MFSRKNPFLSLCLYYAMHNSFCVCFSFAKQSKAKQVHWIRKRDFRDLHHSKIALAAKDVKHSEFTVCLNSAIQPEVIVLWYMKFLPSNEYDNNTATQMLPEIRVSWILHSSSESTLWTQHKQFTLDNMTVCGKQKRFWFRRWRFYYVSVYLTLLCIGTPAHIHVCTRSVKQHTAMEMVMFVNH